MTGWLRSTKELTLIYTTTPPYKNPLPMRFSAPLLITRCLVTLVHTPTRRDRLPGHVTSTPGPHATIACRFVLDCPTRQLPLLTPAEQANSILPNLISASRYALHVPSMIGQSLRSTSLFSLSIAHNATVTRAASRVS